MHSAWLSEELHYIDPAKRHGQLLVSWTSRASEDPCLLHCKIAVIFFPGDSVPVLGIKSFLIVYGEHIMNVSILVTIHVKQRAAMFYELYFKEIFLTLLIKLAYAYPAEYKDGDQF